MLLFSSSIRKFVASNLLSELLADDLAFGFSTVKYFGYFEKILGIALARNLRPISFDQVVSYHHTIPFENLLLKNDLNKHDCSGLVSTKRCLH